jgi:hypothetical protein
VAAPYLRAYDDVVRDGGKAGVRRLLAATDALSP